MRVKLDLFTNVWVIGLCPVALRRSQRWRSSITLKNTTHTYTFIYILWMLLPSHPQIIDSSRAFSSHIMKYLAGVLVSHPLCNSHWSPLSFTDIWLHNYTPVFVWMLWLMIHCCFQTQCLEFHSGYSVEDLAPVVRKLHDMLISPPDSKLAVIRSKYAHK